MAGESTPQEVQDLEPEVERLVAEFEASNIDHLEVYSSDPKAMLQLLKRSYDQFIQAAGGLVLTPDGKVLVIHRLGKWDLPKGKVEAGENLEEAALREVQEETNLKELKLTGHLINTYHTYDMDGKRFLKETAWYLMESPGGKLKPQTEEAISKAVWCPVNDLAEVKNDTYANIRIVLEAMPI